MAWSLPRAESWCWKSTLCPGPPGWALDEGEASGTGSQPLLKASALHIGAPLTGLLTLCTSQTGAPPGCLHVSSLHDGTCRPATIWIRSGFLAPCSGLYDLLACWASSSNDSYTPSTLYFSCLNSPLMDDLGRTSFNRGDKLRER